jgi:hypothetical protein
VLDLQQIDAGALDVFRDLSVMLVDILPGIDVRVDVLPGISLAGGPAPASPVTMEIASPKNRNDGARSGVKQTVTAS